MKKDESKKQSVPKTNRQPSLENKQIQALVAILISIATIILLFVVGDIIIN